MSDQPALLLLPNLLTKDSSATMLLPAGVFAAMRTIDGLIAESEREGRRYLKHFETKKAATAIPIALCNEHTADSDSDFFLEPIAKGERWGLISDAGLPCVADPGSRLVLRAREKGLSVQAFAGPSSLLLALMLSGLPGQKFSFHGYLDRDPIKRRRQLTFLVQQSSLEQATQLMIEAPYRNLHLLESLLQVLPVTASLSVAWDLTSPTEGIITQSVAKWKLFPSPDLEKRPAIFLFYTAQR